MKKSTSDKPQNAPDVAPHGGKLASNSRRRFTKTGLGAGTVIATLVSKPVLGAQYYCTVSGMQSGNTSMHGPAVTCEGCSPDYWKNNPGSWQQYTSYRADMAFANVFDASNYGSMTLMQVLQDQPGSIGSHSVAALLNASASDRGHMTYGYSAQEIINMYQARYMMDTEQFLIDLQSLESPCPLPNDASFQRSGIR